MNINRSPNRRNQLTLIDGHALAFYCWFSSYPQAVIPGFIRELAETVEKHNPSPLIVAFDPPPPTFRHELYPEYKANRPPVPKDFLKECDQLFLELDSLGVSSCVVNGFEADDVLGTVSNKATESGFNVVIVTCDLDLLQLLTPKVTVEVFSQYWPTRTFNMESAKYRFHGIEPHQIADFKALAGDRSDNLPGVKGIGELSASELLKEKEDLESIYDDLDEIAKMPFRGARRVSRLLLENKEEAFKMRDLTTIVRDVPVPIDIESSACGDLGRRLAGWDG